MISRATQGWKAQHCTSVNMNMKLSVRHCLKQIPTVRTVIWSSVAVYMTFVWLQVAGCSATIVTQWTLVWFVYCLNSHMWIYTWKPTKCLDTHVTFVWFLSTVNSHVHNDISSHCESFATITTFKQFLQIHFNPSLSTFIALVFTVVNNHKLHRMFRIKLFVLCIWPTHRWSFLYCSFLHIL